MKTAFSILILAITLSTNAQVRVKNHSSDPKLVTPRSEPKNDVQSQNNQFAHWGTTSFGGNVAIGFGGGSYYGNSSPYNSYYFNNYSLKKTTRNSIRSAKYMINDAVAFDTWNDIYSPLVAKAIRHYNYARQLYSRGNYQAAYNHAERAGYLAWYSLQYFRNPGYYNGGFYQPGPYSDPYNPYYRNAQEGNNEAGRKKNNGVSQAQGSFKQDTIDNKLPDSDKSDKEVLRAYSKSDNIDE